MLLTLAGILFLKVLFLLDLLLSRGEDALCRLVCQVHLPTGGIRGLAVAGSGAGAAMWGDLASMSHFPKLREQTWSSGSRSSSSSFFGSRIKHPWPPPGASAAAAAAPRALPSLASGLPPLKKLQVATGWLLQAPAALLGAVAGAGDWLPTQMAAVATERTTEPASIRQRAVAEERAVAEASARCGSVGER